MRDSIDRNVAVTFQLSAHLGRLVWMQPSTLIRNFILVAGDWQLGTNRHAHLGPTTHLFENVFGTIIDICLRNMFVFAQTEE